LLEIDTHAFLGKVAGGSHPRFKSLPDTVSKLLIILESLAYWDDESIKDFGSKDVPIRLVARFPKWYPELSQYHLVHTGQGLISHFPIYSRKISYI
jgi:hypothetical protein